MKLKILKGTFADALEFGLEDGSGSGSGSGYGYGYDFGSGDGSGIASEEDNGLTITEENV